MIRRINAGKRTGKIDIPSSKSAAHRTLICAALANKPSVLFCKGLSKDIEATVRCLHALGADIKTDNNGRIDITPIKNTDGIKHLYCGESGSTFRFILPIVGALGCTAVFHLDGRLSERPIDALTNALEAHGITVTREGNTVKSEGKLTSGEFEIPGNISSQFVSGLLFALPLTDGENILRVTEKTESADYIAMTESAIEKSGIKYKKNKNIYNIPGGQSYLSCGISAVEQDWSNAAFFLCMGAFSEKGVTVNEMPFGSKQGDKEIVSILEKFGAKTEINGNSITVRGGKLRGQVIDARAIPDLVPTISAVAAGAEGETRIINAARLRFKESDRLKTTSEMLKALGADVKELTDGIVIHGKEHLLGGCINAENDHRIAMAAAVASCICENDVTVNGAECTDKSYPDFWNDLEKLEVYR